MKISFPAKELIFGSLLLALHVLSSAQAPQVKMSKALGGSLYDRSYDIKNIGKGSYIIAGVASSSDGQVFGFHGSANRGRSARRRAHAGLVGPRGLGEDQSHGDH